MENDLTKKQKSIIFWASFLALMAAGVGFGIRVMNIGTWMDEFSISGTAAGGIFGASLWPIAVSMILFSLIVDKIGYRVSMVLAFAFQLVSTYMTFTSTDVAGLTTSFLLAGFGHGIIEACINPLCATMYKKQKSKMLNILHASWPAGVAVGAVLCLRAGDTGWRTLFWFVTIPAAAYGIVFLLFKKYPQDERVENNVSYLEMLKEFGGLSIFLATTFLVYELGGVFGFFGDTGSITGNGTTRLLICLAVGSLVGLVSGIALKSKGKILFFILCLIMIPLATAEIATDGWIQKLMKPMLASEYGIDSGWAIVLSSIIMMVLRFFAGVPLKFMSPPTLLLVSSLFSIAGLFMLSEVNGVLIILAFILYGIGQTFYWPTVLGFTAEQFPKGGAMTLNTVSAMGLLTVGIFGMPFLGAIGDKYDGEVVQSQQPALYSSVGLTRNPKTKEVSIQPSIAKDGNFFAVKYKGANVAAVSGHPSLTTDKAKELNKIINAGKVPTKEDIATAKLGQADLDKLNKELTSPATAEQEALISFYNAEIQGGIQPSKEAIEAAQKAKGLYAKLKRDETHNENGVSFLKSIDTNQRKVLKWAAGLPLVMGIAFLLIILWFKSKGGYKPVELSKGNHPEDEVAQF